MREKTAGSELALRGGCDRDRVDSLEVSTGHNNSVYIMTRGHNPMDTEPDKEIAPGEASRTERLLESLSRVESFGQFWQTIRGCEDEVVEPTFRRYFNRINSDKIE